MNDKPILILGVTAGGKGRLAFNLAKKINAEIISIDSMKVYRRMDIGTAKPPKEARQQVKYHLIDVVEPSESFSVDKFLDLTSRAMEQIRSAGKSVIAVGGTAMYIKALLYGLFDGPGTDEKIRQSLKARITAEGLPALHRVLAEVDPEAAERIHPNDQKRIIRAMEVYELTKKPISSFQRQFEAPKPLNNYKIIGLRREKPDANSRINSRVKKMIDLGLVDEARILLAESTPLSDQACCAIGYAEIIDHLTGNISLADAAEQIKINTRKFAKNPRTRFKTFKDVDWLDIAEDELPEKTLERAINLLGPS